MVKAMPFFEIFCLQHANNNAVMSPTAYFSLFERKVCKRSK